MKNWERYGLIFNTKLEMPFKWSLNSALTPTPLVIEEQNIVRVFCGFRDAKGISRIGYVDLDIDNPKKVIDKCTNPCLDIGERGEFDDNGLILGDVIKIQSNYYMFYVGFQLVNNVKFFAFSGLATSEDGKKFVRKMKTPFFDRTQNARFINAIHSVRFEDGIWKIWHAMGDSWHQKDGIDYPGYEIFYSESKNLEPTSFSKPKKVIQLENDEYRIGRPSVSKINNNYAMIYTKGYINSSLYNAGIAISQDGQNWSRNDKDFGLQPSKNSYENMHLCYPRIFNIRDSIYAVYNGNNMGVDGFCLARLIS